MFNFSSFLFSSGLQLCRQPGAVCPPEESIKQVELNAALISNRCCHLPLNTYRFSAVTPGDTWATALHRRLWCELCGVYSHWSEQCKSQGNLKGTSFPLKIARGCGLWRGPQRERVKHGQHSCSVPWVLSGDLGVCGSHRCRPACVGANFITASSSMMGLWRPVWNSTSLCQTSDHIWTCRYGCQLDLWGRVTVWVQFQGNHCLP